MKELDLNAVPLEGTTLIEASAGTGKTWSITGLFLRLVLEKKLAAEQILVVTFTNAATEELRIRVRKRLLQARKALTTGRPPGKDPLMHDLVQRHRRDPHAVGALADALREFDRAAIFTIHGFCRRLLQDWAFETGAALDLQLVTDPVAVEQEVCDDFWRMHFHPAPPEFNAFCEKHLKGPDALYALRKKIRRAEATFYPRIQDAPLTGLDTFRRRVAEIKAAWPESRETVAALLNASPLNRRIYSKKRCRELVEGLDHLAESDAAGFPLMAGFDKLTPAALQAAVKKGGHAPRHPFFEACGALHEAAEALERQMHTRLTALKLEFFQWADAELEKKKRRLRVHFYEDLLLAVRNALRGRGGPRLIRSVSERYRAALVDEFQDTDPIQYEIFSRLFSKPGQAFFMIGDPKQAVYGFRGADVFSYMEAARRAPKRHTLTRNFRSTPGLVRSINTLFAEAARPFIFTEIPFMAGTAAAEGDGEGAAGPAPMQVWFIPGKNGKPLGKAEATQAVAAAVRAEIVSLLDAGMFQEKEIAVLVRTHRQAWTVKQALVQGGIPAVVFSDKNVFDSHEAAELERVLLGIQDPWHRDRVKSALATDLVGLSAADLDPENTGSSVFDAALSRFHGYQDLWRRRGFIPMFADLMRQERVKARLIRYPDGERRLTNLAHLAELIQEAASMRPLPMERLVKWISERRDPDFPRLEAHQLRLESDENAVSIVTMHRSKGLEYPVVFCPFAWEGAAWKDAAAVFHDPASGFPLVVDLDPEHNPKSLFLAKKERLAESIRLLYVALTRAKTRCYLAWGRIQSAPASALGYLLYPPHQGVFDDPGQPLDAHAAEHFSTKSDAELLADLRALADRAEGCMAVARLPVAGKEAVRPEKPALPVLSCRRFSGGIPAGRKTASYSSLMAGAAGSPEEKDYDTAPRGVAAPEPVPSGIFAFPAGARAGRFFHAFLESLDFSVSPAKQTDLAAQLLTAFGFDAHWAETVCDTAARVLSTRLPAEGGELHLRHLSPAERVHEMEFDFPVKKISPEALAAAFAVKEETARAAVFSGRMGRLFFAPWEGFMRGFMDLVAVQAGKYYLIDWKSNLLGAGKDAYANDTLAQVVEAEYYFLQYHLYVVALCRYLKLKTPDFSYENDFGGVFYLFIRGMHPDPETGVSGTGVYYDRPPEARIASLESALIPFS